MKKKLFAILLSIVMVAGLLPATALATEPTVYDIWVDGVQVTSENKDNLFSGTVSYDPTTHTLSLNNATLDNDTMSDYGIKTTIPSTLKIRLTGTKIVLPEPIPAEEWEYTSITAILSRLPAMEHW